MATFSLYFMLWKNKVQTKRTHLNTSQIGGKCDDQSIANVFADYYSNSVTNNYADNNSYIFDVSSENLGDWLFDTDDVDRVIFVLLSMVKQLAWMESPLNI